MKREIITTSDGSVTIRLPKWDENYHSIYGAIQEAKHVFIQNGLSLFQGQSVSVLEIGFGTGLNAFITFLESIDLQLVINYVGYEAYPIAKEELEQLNYVTQLNALNYQSVFDTMHYSNWGEPVTISSHFILTKRKQFFNEIDSQSEYDLIYFDAFGYNVQPELWSVEQFHRMYKALKSGGVLVTYACRGNVKRAMIEVGFTVEKLPGPPGKREMLRAFKGH